MNGDRDEILARIAEALTVPGRHPHAGPLPEAARGPTPLPAKPPLATPDASGARVTARFREWLPRVGDSPAERRALFASQSAALKTELCDGLDLSSAATRLAALAADKGWRRLALHHAPLTDALAALLPPSLELLYTGEGYEKAALEACDAGLTECECLVAQTGSVCVTSRSSGGRALSVLPPHHIVIARAAQLVPDLSAAFELLAGKYAGDYPSFITFISGPSRTGDIERILVLGAHGPKWLTVLLLE
jgi:L-lactate dehydrogenase complex protein LldG